MRKIALLIILFLYSWALADRVSILEVMDYPNDSGNALVIRLNRTIFEGLQEIKSDSLFLERAESTDSQFASVAAFVLGDTASVFVDRGLSCGKGYFYRVSMRDSINSWSSAIFGPFQPDENWYNSERTNVMIGIILTGLIVAFFIVQGRRNRELYLRPIAGLLAVDEAIGRATEMGKPILYSSGRGGIQRPATIASMNILGSVAEKVASYGTPLIFPNNDPLVTAVAQEVVKEGYTKAGHADSYNPNNIYFVTDSQFGYAAAVDGIMLREKPATNLFFGTFEAESLILAETGNSVGALQIAGTDSSIQMAFFIVSCDYVLIGEELFAASGYLSRDPQVVGTLKGSDMLKMIITVLLIAGALLALSGQSWFVDLLVTK
jgi:hypothetical protein